MSKIIMGGHEITAQKDYSTDEVFTGQYWIDGKKIYRKVFTGTTPSTIAADQVVVVSTGITTIRDIINLRTCLDWNNGTNSGTVFDGWLTNDSFNNRLRVLFNREANNITLNMSGSHFASQNYRIIVEYTKTTD